MLADCVVLLAFLEIDPNTSSPAIKPIVWHAAAGYAQPLWHTGDLFDGGYSVSGGATFHSRTGSHAALRLEAGYDRFDATQQVVESDTSPKNAQVDEGYLSMTRLVADVLYDWTGKGRVGFYFGGGVGGYSRYLTLTRTSLGELSCDPLGNCVLAGEGFVIHDTDRTTKFGYDFSAALTIATGSNSQIYFEGSYRRVHTDPRAQYVPLLVGFRF